MNYSKIIGNKWKKYSLSLFLCEWEGDSIELFDSLTEADYQESKALFDKFDVIIWEPMERLSIDDLSELIITTAYEAQRIEKEAAQ
jgi:hypothetical protein